MTQLTHLYQPSFWEKVALFSPLQGAGLVETNPRCCHDGNQHTPGTDARHLDSVPPPTSAAGITHSTLLRCSPRLVGNRYHTIERRCRAVFGWPWLGLLTNQKPRRFGTMDFEKRYLSRRGLGTRIRFVHGHRLSGSPELTPASGPARQNKRSHSRCHPGRLGPCAQVEYVSQAIAPSSGHGDGSPAIDDPQVVPASYEESAPRLSTANPSAAGPSSESQPRSRRPNPSLARRLGRPTNRPTSGPPCRDRSRR